MPKRFTVTTVHLRTTRFTGNEYRAYFGVAATDDELAAQLADDNGAMARHIQSFDDFGTKHETTETDHDVRDY